MLIGGGRFYIGGLSTSLVPLLSNLPLSTAVAATGIVLPICLSFLLIPIVPGTTPLQAFAAGAALSATSLGTTFSILTFSGFAQTRLGTVLTGAAMMDDVVGLVMIQVVAGLGSGEISAETVGRPIGASVGLLVFVVLGCRWIVGPVYRRFSGATGEVNDANLGKVFSRVDISGGQKLFLVHSGVLLALVTGASYAGTSVLFAAFLAGAAVSWWDKLGPSPHHVETSASGTASPASIRELRNAASAQDEDPWTGARVYEHYFAPSAQRILVPFFFASIGFSIPITQLFNPATLWRGLIYALLMALVKFMTGLWLLRVSPPRFVAAPLEKLHLLKKTLGRSSAAASVQSETELKTTSASDPGHPQKSPQKPRSLYPPSILGLAMIARGEIGFLIASVAEARGIFAPPSAHSSEHSIESSELYLIVIWATVLCTMLGPVAVGLCVRRVKALEKERIEKGGAGTGVLGAWGVEQRSG